MRKLIKSANPYMPLWEHVPDGEPRVFEFQGEKRVYLYGSHDTAKTCYCGDDYVCWSAPVDDLTDWTCHGTCYRAEDNSILYAPDVVQKGDTFYMYAADRCGGKIVVASSKNPAGPFTNPRETKLGFDPGVLVDDDGRVYAFWGFSKSYAAELCDDMVTIKEDTIVKDLIGHSSTPWSDDSEGLDKTFAFFEASSPRKVGDKYVLVYSKRTNVPQPELGVYDDNNGFLSYAYSDSPLGPYTFGGDISFNGGEIIKNPDGTGTMTYRWGNNHGSIACVNGQWYIFYHRHIGTDEYSRQAMLDPIEVDVDKNGRVFIGKITYKDGEPVASVPTEMTSQGGHLNGLDARSIINAGYACVLCGGSAMPYIKPVYEKIPGIPAPIVNITSGVTAGYRYLQFGTNSPKTVTIKAKVLFDCKVKVRVDSMDGRIVGETSLKDETEGEFTIELNTSLTSKRAVYFEFEAENKDVFLAELEQFWFD